MNSIIVDLFYLLSALLFVLGIKGLTRPIYLYDNNVLEGKDLEISEHEIKLPGYRNSVNLEIENPFEDMS